MLLFETKHEKLSLYTGPNSIYDVILFLLDSPSPKTKKKNLFSKSKKVSGFGNYRVQLIIVYHVVSNH